MPISRFHEAQPLAPGQTVDLSPETVQHIRALRLESGAAVVLFNGDGQDYQGELTLSGKKQATVAIKTEVAVESESPVAVRLGIGMSLGDRMEYAIQKATELGVLSITPLATERSELRLKGERAEKKQARWQQVAISAAEQCARARVPEVAPVQALADWLQTVPLTDLRLVLHHEHATRLQELPPPTAITALIGPEGGLSEQDLARAQAAGFTPVVLGPRVLRTETAPVALLSAVQALWGDY
ncbi:16S rRNA (uracil(1498)-N(3))-methyltransferase [Natronospirillum operosum]|uniref:Ribosomal RNA small subunit methyltransferase E n=1 Tax=Natronospirillum operosum TaxID=2759953 RepID=A0A4Z0W8R2_9GAMM|nr:16S rRNA (uracil(1498)-N(3))-methyltransferase [Natronospirillum operosum]TGG90318.1 16S rRNA (uracil(1498)-N(3))-methyltransferase [Natronospirillum operosum]